MKSLSKCLQNVFNKYDLLGDSWNYMSPILVSSPAKRIATQILVIAELSERKYFFSCFACDTNKHPSQQGITCSKLATEAQE